MATSPITGSATWLKIFHIGRLDLPASIFSKTYYKENYKFNNCVKNLYINFTFSAIVLLFEPSSNALHVYNSIN